jgi:hypothetical protein
VAINFPSNPVPNQAFTAAGVTWTWDGSKWIMSAIAGGGGGSGGASITVADIPPNNPIQGSLWFNSANGQLYVWYNDGSSAQWVTVVNQGLGGLYLPLSGGNMSGPIIGVTGDTINGSAGTNRSLFSSSGGSTRWELQLASSDAEVGSNAGSNFNLVSYNDVGAQLAIPISINRATGAITLSGPLTLSGNAINPLGAATAQQIINENRIINGDMRIDQRNSGNPGTAGGYTVDRWQFAASLTTKGTWQQGNTNGPPGFGKFLAFASNSAYVPAAADYFGFLQIIEADMVTDFAWGTPQAQPVTLSFWAVSNLSGTFSGSFTNMAVNRSYVFTYSLVANTWTKVVITIPADTGGTWVMAGNAGSVRVMFCFGIGTTYAGPAGAWSSNYYLGATGTINVVGSATGQFNLTGVKLEIGSVATPFNRQTMAKSLSDCLRYYQVTTPMYLYGYAGAGNLIAQTITFPIMRAMPTVISGNASSNNTTTPGVNTITVNSLLAFSSIVTAGSGYWEFGLTMSAELF